MVNTKRIKPNSRTNSNISFSMCKPKWPAKIPANNTPAMPSPTPLILIADNARPATATSINTKTAQATGWATDISEIHFMAQEYSRRRRSRWLNFG